MSSLFAVEIRFLLLAFSIFITGLEGFAVYTGDIEELPRDAAGLCFVIFFFLFTVLEYIFRLFADKRISAVVSVLPAVPVFFLLTGPAMKETFGIFGITVLSAACLRLIFTFMPRSKLVFSLFAVLLDAIAVFFVFFFGSFSGGNKTDTLTFIALSILTLSGLESLLSKGRAVNFTFYAFLIIGLLAVPLPVGEEPVDWSFLIRAGEAIAQKTIDIADNIGYFFSQFTGGEAYEAGYSDLSVNGEIISGNDRTQLVLNTADMPYYLYYDETSGEKMKMRKTVYLNGGRGVEREWYVDFLQLLHDNDVTRDEALCFSQLSRMNVEYVYLDTTDEIAPAGSLRLTGDGKNVTAGTGEERHKKGYRLSADYLDVDLGSPYLTGMLSEAGKRSGADDRMSFEEACSYSMEIYSVDLGRLMDAAEYENLEAEDFDSYLDTSGVSDRMRELAKKLTDGVDGSYDRCRVIEAYLRQYTYTTDAVGGKSADSDMSTAAGMADIADRFLFETGEGYCVHFTSAMVMLLRCVGIPARPVTGFRYSFPFEAQPSYEVTGAYAHAWPEAYIGNAGYVRFEPTGAYSAAAERTWHRTAKEIGDTLEELSGPEIEDMLLPVNLIENNGAEAPEEGEGSDPVFGIIPVIVILIAAIPVVFLAVFFAVRWLSYVFGTNEKKLYTDVELIKKKIRRRTRGRVKDIGILSDFAEACGDSIRSEVETVFAVYYRVKYGNEDERKVSDEEAAFAGSVRRRVGKARG